jgi:hypothetical protein
MQLVSSSSSSSSSLSLSLLPSPPYTQDKFTFSLITPINVSEIKSIMSIIILMGQTLLDYRYTEPVLEIPVTGKLFNMKQT